MKKIYTLVFAALSIATIHSQAVDDSTNMETTYTNQVFYSLDNGTVSSVDNTNWDLAFSTSGQGAAGSAILVNDAFVSLWAAPNDTTAWTTLDTAGIANWELLLNSDTSWTNGAFNKYRGTGGFFDMGWGTLQPSNNFWTFGDSLYVAKLKDNTYRKIWIVSLKTGSWEFKYANLDGTNEQIVTFAKATYPNRNFVYYSMIDNMLMDREPDNNSWDLSFFKHKDYLFPPGMYLNVTSVFNNKNVWSAKSHEADLATALTATAPQTTYNQNVINIGREWKKFSSATGWVVRDTIAYFIYDNDSTDFYRMVFTGFGGSGTGKSYFTKERLGTVAIHENTLDAKLSLYPNPATDVVTILMDYPYNEAVQLTITDLSGKIVQSLSISLVSGINQKQLYLNNLSAGLYLINVGNERFYHSEKLLIK